MIYVKALLLLALVALGVHLWVVFWLGVMLWASGAYRKEAYETPSAYSNDLACFAHLLLAFPVAISSILAGPWWGGW